MGLPQKFDPRGDCEDIALDKSMQLIEAGIPWAHQSMCYCMTEPFFQHTGVFAGKTRRGAHAVLLLITDRGDFVLDNRSHSLKQFQDVENLHNYIFLYRSQPGKPLTDPWEIIVKRKG